MTQPDAGPLPNVNRLTLWLHEATLQPDVILNPNTKLGYAVGDVLYLQAAEVSSERREDKDRGADGLLFQVTEHERTYLDKQPQLQVGVATCQ